MSSTLVEGDIDLSVLDAPAGLEFTNTSDNLVNANPADEFDPRYVEDVEGLLWLGRLTSTFNLYGHTFTVKTLTRADRLAVSQIAKEWENTLGMGLAFETATVAACLLLVDGQPINPPLSADENKDPLVRIRKNFDVIKNYYDPIIEGIESKYSALLFRQAQAFAELDRK